MENFILKFNEVLTPILEIKKYIDESLDMSKILALPASKQVLPLIGAEISYAHILAFQQDTEATYMIIILE